MPAILLLSAVLGSAASGIEAGPALSDVDVARRAEDAFRAGVAQRDRAEAAQQSFRQAAAYFAELRRRGAANALLFRNLGNAQALSGDLPAAIVSFRCGLQLAPTNRELQASLDEARAQVVYPSFGALGRQLPPNGPPWLPRIRVKWAFYVAAGSYLLAWVLVARWLIKRKSGPLIGGGLLLLAAGLLAILVKQEISDTARQPFVVIAEDGVLLRKGNSLSFPPRYDVPVNRGVEARLLFARGDWLQIELAGGEVGWVPRRFALCQEPDGPVTEYN